ncbi:uncharacterized protein LAESUDRAFT_645815 [Laetiporus sulphureus 93-53]|uniref:EF-hand domain-containing protein n=1 Tax=Laetiporus sulphureus 93-53 TaxID=1314785 RepID=A0A165G802_9APHY|nr:uncharacterized protein LAESUDRAFT_645815 [Laetiporus sulphureus 93-53]KZT09956.1 hypothetical protein LAESUDRAFT_645815 [Laetiporus sulphureus 93-53]
MEEDAEDLGYIALPTRLKRRIDRAFDDAIASSERDSSPPRKKQKVTIEGVVDSSSSPGGFLLETPQPGGFLVESDDLPGGFVPESDAEEDTEPTPIPLSLIPTALQLLDLQPDDEDVLAVFRNAASGWENPGSARTEQEQEQEQEKYVSRKDWRAVCAALLDTGEADGAVDNQVENEDAASRGLSEEGDSGSEDEYVVSDAQESSSEEQPEDSGDEYVEGGFMRTSGRKRKGRKKVSRGTSHAMSRASTDDAEDEDLTRPRRLTQRQEQECRKAFALFFPDIPDDELEKQRIRIKDITRVAKVIKEKITAEETVQMLEAFSTAPDKSVSLHDFETMMITTKLA